MAFIKVFTREPIEKLYPNSLANSIHMALSEDGNSYIPLNQNYGILFAKASVQKNNTLEEHGVILPEIGIFEGTYYIRGTVVSKEGIPFHDFTPIIWSTRDFIDFTEISDGNTSLNSIPEEVIFSQKVVLSNTLLPAIKAHWIPLQPTSVSLPENICLNSANELDDPTRITAAVTYSDGSVDQKPIFWDMNSLKNTSEGKYTVTGSMQAIGTGFPLTVGLADPVIFKWEDKWYYIATNDNLNDIGIYVRRADSVDALFEDGVETSCILDYDESRSLCQTFWAPEFHVIGGELYILFAVSGKAWGPQCHMMRLKKGGDIMRPESWTDPVRVCRKDGSFLTSDGITLDMTYFKAGSKSYVVWSYRYAIMSPLDTGSMLYIATIDEETPWKLTSDPVLLSRPLFGWENGSGTINNEGPYALLLNDKVYLSYSGGAAGGESYVVGYLIANTASDLLDISNWHKEPSAVLHLQSVDGILGPGHNSFFRDEYGRLMIAYHAQERNKYNCRCSAYHRVHISKSGFPLLNVVGERDLSDDMKKVTIEFTIKIE